MKMTRLLMIEDDSTFKQALFRALTRSGFSVTTASTKTEALTWLQSQTQWDAVLLDLSLPDGSGMDLIPTIKAKTPSLPVIVLTGNGAVDIAVLATEKGACECLQKPMGLDDILTCLKNQLNKHQEVAAATSPTEPLSSVPQKSLQASVIGESQEIQAVMDLVSRVSESDATILIQGESGTGKELIARAIHKMSPRRNSPFIAINCGAIPAELLESELFGHVKGAFTGAISNRVGRFEMADGGILFLDEIGDMSPSLQVKILRALQERSFEPVGSTKSVHVNVQVIAATHINLEKAVTDGRFREDLFYRLNVIPIAIPALRERKYDIPILLQHFLNIFTKKRKDAITAFSADVITSLVEYPWPGNIRELENLVERLTIIKGKGVVELRDLPVKYQVTKKTHETTIPVDDLKSMKRFDLPPEGLDFNAAVDHFENNLIMQALEKTGWNRNQAAILLRLNRTTLVEKMKKKGLRPPDEALNLASDDLSPSNLTEGSIHPNLEAQF